jgi:Bacteriophage tail sheath protein
VGQFWSQIRLSFGAFMTKLFRVGAFQGNKPGDAFYIKCDGTTTSRDDIDRRSVNIIGVSRRLSLPNLS